MFNILFWQQLAFDKRDSNENTLKSRFSKYFNDNERNMSFSPYEKRNSLLELGNVCNFLYTIATVQTFVKSPHFPHTIQVNKVLSKGMTYVAYLNSPRNQLTASSMS